MSDRRAVRQWTARAFTAPGGGGGSSVRVRLHDGPIPAAPERQRIAAGNPELATAFVSADRHSVELHNRKLERRFIGHALLGAAAALASDGPSPTSFALAAGTVAVRQSDDGMWWVSAPSAWSPNDRHRQVASAGEVDAIRDAPADEPVQVWAWIDEAAGVVRARQFAPSEGKPEDEACGSACMVLAATLGRTLRVLHGRYGSVILACPADGVVDVGGHCVVEGLPLQM